jgi:hypothetical protein
METIWRVAGLLLLGLPMLANLSGCKEKVEPSPSPPPFTSQVENPFGLQAAPSPYAFATPSGPTNPSAPSLAASPVRAEGATLAYEHVVDIELSRALLLKRTEDIRAACREAPQSSCTLLDISTRSDERIPSAAIRMRVAPGNVDRLVDLAAAGGSVASRRTHAEDLAEPIADTERQLSMLTTHRDRLSALMKDRALTVDQLVTVSREMSSVQTQLDQLGSTHANLRRRVDTDLLTLNLTLPSGEFRSEQTPVLDAVRAFGSEVREALAQVVGFIALLLPWLIILLPGVIAIRWFWRCTGRWLARRERPVA